MTAQAIELPSISNYGQYSSDNYGAHTLRVNVGPFTLYYSYTTLVAFRAPNTGSVVRSNDWGPTTGKHLNWIDQGSKSDRLPGEKFEAKWAEAQATAFKAR